MDRRHVRGQQASRVGQGVTIEETLQQRWDREKAENRKKYLDLYEGVVAHLKGWEIKHPTDEDDGYNHERLKLVKGVWSIALSLSNGRVHVGGYWPQRKKNGAILSPSQINESSPSITVDPKRGYEAIAREIDRRFLPEYTRIFTKLREKIVAEETYEGIKLANWRRLVDSGNVKPCGTRERQDEEQRGDAVIPGGTDHGYGEVRMGSADSVYIELRSLPVDTALRVLEVLNQK